MFKVGDWVVYKENWPPYRVNKIGVVRETQFRYNRDDFVRVDFMALGSSWIDSSALRLHLGDGDISPWDTEIILGVPYGDEYNLSVDFYWSRRVDDLFDQWKADPCWDVETTEGFEWAHDRLLSLRLEYQAKVDAVYESMLKEKATQLGIPENLPLAEYILRLEHRISRLQDRLESL